MRKRKDPDPESDPGSYLWLRDPDPEGPKTFGSGSPTLVPNVTTVEGYECFLTGTSLVSAFLANCIWLSLVRTYGIKAFLGLNIISILEDVGRNWILPSTQCSHKHDFSFFYFLLSLAVSESSAINVDSACILCIAMESECIWLVAFWDSTGTVDLWVAGEAVTNKVQ